MHIAWQGTSMGRWIAKSLTQWHILHRRGCVQGCVSLSLSLSLSLFNGTQADISEYIYIYIYIYIMGYSGLPRIVLIQRLPDQVQEASFPHRPRWNEPSILPPIWKPHISLFTNPKLKCFSRGAQTNIVKREILKSSRGMSPIEQPQTKCKFFGTKGSYAISLLVSILAEASVFCQFVLT